MHLCKPDSPGPAGFGRPTAYNEFMAPDWLDPLLTTLDRALRSVAAPAHAARPLPASGGLRARRWKRPSSASPPR